MVEQHGVFELIGLSEFEMQRRVISNYFQVLKGWYGPEKWSHKDNVFLYAAGFIGAIDFFRTKLINYCNLKSSYSVETIRKTMDLSSSSLILRSELKNMQGRASARRVTELLDERFSPEAKKPVEIEF